MKTVRQIGAALNQLASLSDMLVALELDSESKSDWTLFPLVSKGYFSKIKEINGEIRECLSEHASQLYARAN